MRSREQRMATVTIGCCAANCILTIAKLVAGVIGKSAAMMADAVHSLSDVIADAAVLIMVKLSAKGKDEKHNWGRGKYETIATVAISILLIFIAIDMILDGISSIRNILSGELTDKPGMVALWVAAISIVTQELIFRWTIHVGKAVESETMIANAWHHRSDALSSVASLIGISGAIYLGGKWTVLDPVIGFIISILIIAVAIKMLIPAITELTDGALPADTVNQIRSVIQSVKDVDQILDLRTRKSGHSNIINAHIAVSPELSVSESGTIISSIRTTLQEMYGEDTIVSIEVRAKE